MATAEVSERRTPVRPGGFDDRAYGPDEKETRAFSQIEQAGSQIGHCNASRDPV
jgi:hypothetical protein